MRSSAARATSVLLLFICAVWAAAAGHLFPATVGIAGAFIVWAPAFVSALRRASAVLDGAHGVLDDSRRQDTDSESLPV